MPTKKKPKKKKMSGTRSEEMGGYVSSYYVAIALAFVALGIGVEGWRGREREKALREELDEYRRLIPHNGNPPWMSDHMSRLDKIRSQLEGTPKQTGYRADESVANGQLDVNRWHSYLDTHTPVAFQSGEKQEGEDINNKKSVDCWNLPDISLSLKNKGDWERGGRDVANSALRECGFLVLDSLVETKVINRLREAYESFRDSERAKKHFRYPCQGKGRFEYMLPFESPFNSTTAPYNNPILRQILLDFLGGPFKLELMTVINSPPGSGDQRWHQGWRYLFHPEEQLPPYSIVVGVPLDDFTPEMGPTQFCPRRKLRFYHGFRCDEGEVVAIGSTKGSVLLFDYKLLHRGPANLSPRFRPMISMVFSKMFFVNAEAYVNRGISMVQTLNQRRYWEEFVWHPEGEAAYFDV
ncbi:hypothetical protein AAMO2058_000486000 [Amorphochlora amoebiformis]